MVSVYNFLKRHLLYVAIAVVCMFALSYIPGIPKDIEVMLKLPIVTAVLLFLASLSHYSYTSINFTTLDAGFDNYSDAIKAAIINGKCRVLGNVFIGVALVISITILGIYFLN